MAHIFSQDYFERKRRAISSFYEKQKARSWHESQLFEFDDLEILSKNISSEAKILNEISEEMSLILECSAHISNQALKVNRVIYFLSLAYTLGSTEKNCVDESRDRANRRIHLNTST